MTKQEVRKSVQFCSVVEVKTIPSCFDYSDYELDQCWYSRSERGDLRRQQQRDRLPFETTTRKGKMPRCSSEACLRGLEGQTANGSALRKRRLQAAQFAVMYEQQLQDQHDLYDPDGLAVQYAAQTQQCQIEAHVTALVDEMYVKQHAYDCSLLDCGKRFDQVK